MLLRIYTKRNNFEDTALERQITQIYIKSRSGEKKKKKKKLHEANRAGLPSMLFRGFLFRRSPPAPDLLVLLQRGRFQSLNQT